VGLTLTAGTSPAVVETTLEVLLREFEEIVAALGQYDHPPAYVWHSLWRVQDQIEAWPRSNDNADEEAA